MNGRRRWGTAGISVAALAAVALGGGAAAQASQGASTALTLGSDPAAVEIAPLPCDRRGELELGMSNDSGSALFVDALVTGSPSLKLSRGVWSTYLPADPDLTVTTPLTITADVGTDPGEYQVDVDAVGNELTIPVTVVTPPGDGPDDNLALYRQAFASSIHPNTTLCGAVDGNTDSSQWAGSGSHDRTPEEFPDTYGVDLAGAYPVGRVVVYTLDSEKYPAAEMGVRDFEIQVLSDGDWITAASVEGNEQGVITLEFDPIEAEQVRIVTTDSNDHKYSRIIELEVYQR